MTDEKVSVSSREDLENRVKGFSRRIETLLLAADGADRPDAARKENPRAVLASLRQGLSGEPRDFGPMMPVVAPYLSEHANRRDSERWFFVVGALAGWHWKSREPGTPKESLGKTASRLREKSQSIDAHFAALLACREDDLHRHLRHIVGLLKGNNNAVDWQELLRDLTLTGWSHPERYVQLKWAKDFYRDKSSQIK
jgi:CRISPR system Cascade subunit CasB